jgi:ferredoxin
VFRLRIPDLFIVDAVVGMEGNGPASPDLRDIGLILASDNAVALDAVIASMMGCAPDRLRFLQKAKEVGLGDYDLNAIEIIGELKQLPDFKLPPLGGEASLQNKAMREFMHARTLLKPQADPELCTGCGTCVDQCPVSALSMGEHVPEVDCAICISCFCCQEICPEGGPRGSFFPRNPNSSQPVVRAPLPALDRENAAFNKTFESKDFLEAITARMEKRGPVFRGE